MVTICTTSLTFNNSTFCPHSVFMCFVWIWEQTAVISLYSINWLVFITEIEGIYCAVLASVRVFMRPSVCVCVCVCVTTDTHTHTHTHTHTQFLLHTLCHKRTPSNNRPKYKRCWEELRSVMPPTPPILKQEPKTLRKSIHRKAPSYKSLILMFQVNLLTTRKCTSVRFLEEKWHFKDLDANCKMILK